MPTDSLDLIETAGSCPGGKQLGGCGQRRDRFVEASGSGEGGEVRVERAFKPGDFSGCIPHVGQQFGLFPQGLLMPFQALHSGGERLGCRRPAIFSPRQRLIVRSHERLTPAAQALLQCLSQRRPERIAPVVQQLPNGGHSRSFERLPGLLL